MLAAHRADFARAFECRGTQHHGRRAKGEAVRDIDALNREYAAARRRRAGGTRDGDRVDRYFGELLCRASTRAKARVQDVLRMNQRQMEQADHEVHVVARRSERLIALAVSVRRTSCSPRCSCGASRRPS